MNKKTTSCSNSLNSWFEDAFHVTWKKSPSVQERLDTILAAYEQYQRHKAHHHRRQDCSDDNRDRSNDLENYSPVVVAVDDDDKGDEEENFQNRTFDLHSDASARSDGDNDGSGSGSCSEELNVSIELDELWGDQKPLIPGVYVTAGEIKSRYGESSNSSTTSFNRQEQGQGQGQGLRQRQVVTTGDKVVCVLKLCLAEIACGETSVSVEEHLRKASIALNLEDHPQVSIQNFCIQCQFGSGPVIFIENYRSFDLSKLRCVSELSTLVQRGYTTNTHAVSLLVDHIMTERPPYGWAVADLGTLSMCVFVAGCQFYGSWLDLASTAVVTSIWIGIRRFVMYRDNLKKFFASIELIVVAFLIGVFTSCLWRYWYKPSELSMCHIWIIFLSSLLPYFPGSEIVYGSYEVYCGKFVHGSSRLVAALIRIMYMAFGLLVGWQTFGRGTLEYDPTIGGVTEDQKSLILGSSCPPFSSTYDHISPWWIVSIVLNFCATPFSLMEFKVNLRDMPIPGITVYITLVLLETLNHGCDGGKCGSLPSFVINSIGLFVAQNIACAFDYFFGFPSAASVAPSILMTAPGAGALIRVLNQMGRDVNQQLVVSNGVSSDLFASIGLVGTSYAFGVVLALSYWSPTITEKQMEGSQSSFRDKRIYFSYQKQMY